MVSNKQRLERKAKPVKKSRESVVLPCKKEIENYRRYQPKAPPLEPSCKHINSNLQCHTLSEAEVKSFYKRFYFTRDRNLQDSFILRHCEARSPKLRGGGIRKRRRNVSALYFVSTRERKVRVCRAAFAGILRVKGYRINHLLKLFRKGGDTRAQNKEEFDLDIVSEKPKKKVTFAEPNNLNSSFYDIFNTALKNLSETDLFLNSTEFSDIPDNLFKKICDEDNINEKEYEEFVKHIDNIFSSEVLDNIETVIPVNEANDKISPNKFKQIKHVTFENPENNSNTNLSTPEKCPELAPKQGTAVSEEYNVLNEDTNSSSIHESNLNSSEQDEKDKYSAQVKDFEGLMTNGNTNSEIPTLVPKESYDKCNPKGKGLCINVKKKDKECSGMKTTSLSTRKGTSNHPKTAQTRFTVNRSENNGFKAYPKSNNKNKVLPKGEKGKSGPKCEKRQIGLVKNVNKAASAVIAEKHDIKEDNFQNACDMANESFEAFLDANFLVNPFENKSSERSASLGEEIANEHHNSNLQECGLKTELSCGSGNENIRGLKYDCSINKDKKDCHRVSSKSSDINHEPFQKVTEVKSTNPNSSKYSGNATNFIEIYNEIEGYYSPKVKPKSNSNLYESSAKHKFSLIKFSHNNLLHELKETNETNYKSNKNEDIVQNIHDTYPEEIGILSCSLTENISVPNANIKEIQITNTETNQTTKAALNNVNRKSDLNGKAVKEVNTSPILVSKTSTETNTENSRTRVFTWSTPRIMSIPKTKTELKNRSISKYIQFDEKGSTAVSASNSSSVDTLFKNPADILRKEQRGCRPFRCETKRNNPSQLFDYSSQKCSAFSICLDNTNTESDNKENLPSSLCTNKNSFHESKEVPQLSTSSSKMPGRVRSRLGRRNVDNNNLTSSDSGKTGRVPLQTLQIDLS